MRLGIASIACVRPVLILCLAKPLEVESFSLLRPQRLSINSRIGVGLQSMEAQLDDAGGSHQGMPRSPPAILPPNAPLPFIKDGVTVLSFNVLLPNGNDGWWIYKSYQPHVPEEHRTWPFRQALMRDFLLRKDADVVCIQEASAATFEEDFAFMRDAGYESVLHTKFRFRSATFFKAARLELACEKHKDRVLITGLRTIPSIPTGQRPRAAPQASPTVKPATEASFAAPNTAEPRSENETTGNGRNGREPDGSETSPAAAESMPQRRGRLLMVVNCHLTGGPAPERRMRQAFDALDTARKEAARLLVEEKGTGTAAAKGGAAGKNTGRKQKGGDKGASAAPPQLTPRSVPVIVCGDFNSNSPTAVSELLKTGVVEASFRERGYPETAITSKDKRQAFGNFGDVYEEAYCADALDGQIPCTRMDEGLARGTDPPATFLVPLLHPHFLAEDGEGISSRLQGALTQVFRKFVAESDGMGGILPGGNETGIPPFLPRHGVEAWLLTINRALGRGSEFRAAEALMGPGPGGGLTLEDFLSIYAMELREGKFWGVAHDIHACEVELPGGMPWVGPYTARFDHVFYSKTTLEAIGAMEPLSSEERLLVQGGDCLPNSWHPSDHLAVAGAFRFR